MIRWILLALGLLGLALVGQAAWGYGLADPVALVLVVLIGIGLAIGWAEQLRRLAHIEALAAEAHALPRPASEALFAAPPPLLTPFLRALRTGEPAPAAPVGFTPYLVRLMILLGVLGTFLGLVLTMSGALVLMHDAPDAESVRAGLQGPIAGALRAFGTSVVGIGASIILGLVALLVRRAEARVGTVWSAYVTAELALFTPIGRQTAALEAMLRSSAALPDAAASLSVVSERLSALEGRLAEQREVAAEHLGEAAAAAAREAAAAVHTAAESVAGRFSEDLRAASARAESAVERLARAATESASAAVGDQLGRLGAQLDAHAEARAEAERSHLGQVEAALGTTTQKLEATEAARLSSLRADFAAILERLEAQAGAQRAAETELLLKVGEAGARQAESLQTNATALLERVDALTARLGSLGEETRVRQSALTETLGSMEQTRLARLEAAQTTLMERLDVQEQARQSSQQAMLDRLDSAVAQQTEATGREAAGILGGLEQVQARLVEVERARAEALRADFVQLMQALRAAQEREAADARERAAAAEAQAQALAGAAERGVEALQAPIQGILDRVEGAVITLTAAERHRADALNDRLDAVVGHVQAIATRIDQAESARVQAFGAAVDRLRSALEETATGAQREASALVELARTYREALVAAEDQTGARLEDAAARIAGAADVQAQTGVVVREAADLLKGGGAELAAVAEMFAHAVDGYRDSTERSLTALGRVQDAVSGSDGDLAGRLMGEYLDQTREIFGDAMRFQRELFTELRALRGER